MLRTINLHLIHIGIHRFSTIGHPKALDACYGAHWRLLRPDFHWQAVDSFQNTRLSPVRTCAHRAHKKNDGMALRYTIIPFVSLPPERLYAIPFYLSRSEYPYDRCTDPFPKPHRLLLRPDKHLPHHDTHLPDFQVPPLSYPHETLDLHCCCC